MYLWQLQLIRSKLHKKKDFEKISYTRFNSLLSFEPISEI